MAVESTDELEGFFDPEEFGDVSLFSWDDNQREVAGLFDDPAIGLTPTGIATGGQSSVTDGQLDITDRQPRFICPTHRVDDIPRKAIFSIDGADYTIANRKREGGLTHFYLHVY